MKGKGSYIKDLNGKSIKDLVQLRKKLKQELYGLKMKNSMRSLKEISKIGDVRKKIARVSTILTYKIKESHGNDMK